MLIGKKKFVVTICNENNVILIVHVTFLVSLNLNVNVPLFYEA